MPALSGFRVRDRSGGFGDSEPWEIPGEHGMPSPWFGHRDTKSCTVTREAGTKGLLGQENPPRVPKTHEKCPLLALKDCWGRKTLLRVPKTHGKCPLLALKDRRPPQSPQNSWAVSLQAEQRGGAAGNGYRDTQNLKTHPQIP